MKPRILPTARLSFPLASAIAALLTAPIASAVNLYWDIDGATAGAGGATPSGTWSTGGTTWSISPNGTAAAAAATTAITDDLFFSAGVNATGAYTATLTDSQSAQSLTFQDGAATISGAGGIITLGGTGLVNVTNSLAASPNSVVIGAATNTIIAGSTGLTKTGVGTLTLSGTDVNTVTGGLTINGGTLALNFANLATPTDLINSGNALALGGGALSITGKSTDTTNQSLGNVTINSGGGQILGNKNGGTNTNIILGSITATATGGSLLVGNASTTAGTAPVITTTTDKDATGIYGGRVLFFNGTANTGYDWATTASGSSPYTLSGFSTYTTLPATGGLANTNYQMTANTVLAGSFSVNTLKIGTAGTLVLDVVAGNTLTIASGGLLVTGSTSAAPKINNGSITVGNGSGSYDLVVNQFNSIQPIVRGITGGNLGLATTIQSNITNNDPGGANNPVTLVKAGTGSVVLTGTNSFTGGIVINAGTLGLNSAGSLNNNSITANVNTTILNGPTLTSSGGMTLNNGSQVTVLNNGAGSAPTFIINGPVTGTGGVSIAQGGQGTAGVTLGSTSNSFTGPLRFTHNNVGQSAFISVGSLADTAAYGEGNITFGGDTGQSLNHTFTYSATSGSLTLANRRIELANTQVAQAVNNTNTQPLTVNSDLLVSGTQGKVLTLGSTSSGISTFTGIISDAAAPTTGSTLLAVAFTTTPTGTITLASVKGISTGATITGTGIAAGTTITAINPYTRVVTLSANTNGTAGAIGQTMTVAGVTNTVSISKTGSGTWVLGAANTYTGATSIAASGGVLQLGDGGTAGSLSVSSPISVGTSATFAVNQSDTVIQGTDFSNVAIIGAGGFRQAGSGNTVLNLANTFSGASSVRNGTLTLDGGANRIGSTGSVVIGDTGTTGKLILGGTTTADQTLSGLTTTGLGGSVVGGNGSNSTLTLTISGATSTYGGTLGGAGTNENNLALTKAGTNSLTLTSANTYLGPTAITTTGTSGALIVTADGALGSSAAGTTVAPGTSLGFSGGIDYTTTELVSGSGVGSAVISGGITDLSRGFIQSVSGNNTFRGNIELNANGLSRIGTQNGASLTLTGAITQASGVTTATILFRPGNTAGDFVTLSNAGNSFGGDTQIFSGATTGSGNYTGVRLGINNALPTSLTISGLSTTNATTTALDLAGFNQSLNGLITGGGGLNIINLNTITPSSLTLNPTADKATTNTLILGGVGLGVINVDKIGSFTQTLTGSYTYTGTTTVSAGTLALVGGSHESPITVNNLASLGFTLGSSTTSNAAVTFVAGSTVKITGTPAPATSYTLLTTTSTISGTPVLDAPIAGFQLQVDGGNTLKLIPTPAAGYSSWATLNGAGANLNDDHDSDGVSNGVEYFIGGPSGNTTGFTPVPGVIDTAGVLSVTWTKAASYSGTYGTDFWVETSATLANPWVTQIADPNPGFTVTFPSATEVKYTFPAGTTNFVRLKVTGP